MTTKLKTFNGWQDLQTLQSKEILSELMDAKEYQKALLLISDTGLGKTNTIKIFKRSRSAHTYVITVGDSYKLIDVVDSILEVLDIKCEFKTYAIKQKLSLISSKLQEIRNKNGSPIIIIDEAENLKPQVLKMIKELYDAIHHNCSITLIGTEQILDGMLNRKSKNRQSVPQLWRRFEAGVRYITPLNKARDFAPFFKMYIPDELDLQDLLIEKCNNYGVLHDRLEPVLRYAAKNNKPVTEQLFRLYHKMPPSKAKK